VKIKNRLFIRIEKYVTKQYLVLMLDIKYYLVT